MWVDGYAAGLLTALVIMLLVVGAIVLVTRRWAIEYR